MSYLNKQYLETQFQNFADRVMSVFAKKEQLPLQFTKAQWSTYDRTQLKDKREIIITDDENNTNIHTETISSGATLYYMDNGIGFINFSGASVSGLLNSGFRPKIESRGFMVYNPSRNNCQVYSSIDGFKIYVQPTYSSAWTQLTSSDTGLIYGTMVVFV